MMRWLLVVALAACRPAPMPPALAPIDRSCSSNDDCVFDWHYSATSGKCCSAGCEVNAVSLKWKKHVDQVCSRIGYDDDCPTKKCVMPTGTQCSNGICTIVP